MEGRLEMRQGKRDESKVNILVIIQTLEQMEMDGDRWRGEV
jgi:hypothetical protein